MTLVDSNVLIDIWEQDPRWAAWSGQALAAAAERGVVVVNTVILAELARMFDGEEDLTRELARAGVRLLPLPVSAAWPAARAFGQYRKRGGERPRPFADFFIGAHALVEEWPLLTRDSARYRTYFPNVKLIAPK